MTSWFDVDKKGLAALVEGRDKSFVLYELIQNALDEPGVKRIDVVVKPEEGRPYVEVIVEDDAPDGFRDMTHAFTMFAPSRKKANPEERGIWNMGEKLVLALCREATVVSTKGAFAFTDSGRRPSRERRDHGSMFHGFVRMTRDEMAEMIEAARRILVPSEIRLSINGDVVPPRLPMKEFKATLQTVIAGEDGVPRKRTRATVVRLHPVMEGETATLHEMGIPVVAIECAWHVDVGQKVPLNMNRDNVPPTWLRGLRSEVLNNAHALLPKDQAGDAWVTEATTDERASVASVSAVLDARYGEKRVAYDPSDLEANSRAVAAGFVVIHGRELPKATWGKVRDAGLAQPAGRVTPGHFETFSSDGRPVKEIECSKWTPGMGNVAFLYQAMARVLLGVDLNVRIVADAAVTGAASYSPGELMLNKFRLGGSFFEEGPSVRVLSLGIHELAHHLASNHLSDEFHEACCLLGAKMALSEELQKLLARLLKEK